MAYATKNNVSLMTLKFTVVFMSLSFCVVAQPIANNKNSDDGVPQEEVLTVVTVSNNRNDNRKNKAGSVALVQLVVDNDEARKKWFQRREKSLHDSLNGANGHYVKGKDNNEADASAVPSQENAPVATPAQLLALLKKRRGPDSQTEHVRVIRQVITPGHPLEQTIGGYPSPNFYQPQPIIYTSPAPLITTIAPEETKNVEPIASGVDSSIQSARDEYRKSRFAGSAYALALKLSKAGNQPLSEGSSYSG